MIIRCRYDNGDDDDDDEWGADTHAHGDDDDGSPKFVEKSTLLIFFKIR